MISRKFVRFLVKAVVLFLVWRLSVPLSHSHERNFVMSSSIKNTLVVFQATLDLREQTGPLETVGDKALLAGIDVAAGGFGIGAARAFRATLGIDPTLAFVTGSDALGDLIEQLIREEFPNAIRIPTAERSRISLIARQPDDRETIRTTRPRVHHRATVEALKPHLEGHELFGFGSFGVGDGELLADLWKAIGSHGQILWIPTASQTTFPDLVLPLGRRVNVLQLNEAEVLRLTQTNEPTAAICALRDTGISGVIVTRSEEGAVGYFEDQPGGWCSTTGFRARLTEPTGRKLKSGVVGAGDRFAGQILASRAAGQSDWNRILQSAAAAVTIDLRGTRRAAGFDVLSTFASSAERISPRPRKRPGRVAWGHVRSAALWATLSGAVFFLIHSHWPFVGL